MVSSSRIEFSREPICDPFYRDECEAQVKGFHGAKYKKFAQQDEAEEFAGQTVRASLAKQPLSTTETSPTTSTRVTRTSPYKKPEPVSHHLPVIPSVVPTTPIKRPTEAKPPLTSPMKSAKWEQRDSSPDVQDESIWDVVYSDGACKGNGQASSVAGIGVWWGRDDPRCAGRDSFTLQCIIICNSET